MIVKCQLPLATTDDPRILIYDKHRVITWMEPVTQEWVDKFDGRLKIYARAHLEGTILVIDQVVQDQSW